MKPFDLRSVYEMALDIGYYENNIDLMRAQNSENKLTSHDYGKQSLEDVCVFCEEMGFVASADTVRSRLTAANRLVDIAKANTETGTSRSMALVDELGELHKQFRRCFKSESAALRFFYIERDRLQFWNDRNTDDNGTSIPCHLDKWRDILSQLPQEATDDVVEAGKCYACSRYTACVHHLCRVFENGLKNFATRHNVVFKYAIEQTSWKQLSDDLKNHKDTNPLLSASDIAAIFKVRDQIAIIASLWRNPTAHSTGTFYTDEQAYAIYHAVRELMKDLVTL